jgi:microcystin-dependent protein
MTSFVFTWNSAFLTEPADTEYESLGAGRIRDTRSAVGERFQVDHALAGDANDGKHNKVTLPVQAATITTAAPLTLDVGDGCLFSQSVTSGGTPNTELFFQDSSGNVVQLTSGGTFITKEIGEIYDFGGPIAPARSLACLGQAISRITYALLFAVIGTTFGAGDGSNTFNLPPPGCVRAGADPAGTHLTSASLGVAAAVGVIGGSELSQSHTHTLTDPGHLHSFTTGYSYDSSGGDLSRQPAQAGQAQSSSYPTNTAATGITIATAGTGTSQNVQPTMIVTTCIYAGA